jgi:hypothetical protein
VHGHSADYFDSMSDWLSAAAVLALAGGASPAPTAEQPRISNRDIKISNLKFQI